MRARLSVPALLVAAAIAVWAPLAAQESRPVEKVSLRVDQALDIFLDVIRESKLKKDWPRALRALREIERFIKTNGDEYILPVSAPSGQTTGVLYTSAREAAFRELATFPKEALASWRLSADRAVCDALGACRLKPDIYLLEEVVAKFPISSFAPEALDLLGAIYLERADFPRALRVCARADAFFPGLVPEMKARFDLLRIISLTGLTGTRPGHLIARFKADFAHAKLPFHGSPAPACKVLAVCLASIRPPSSRLPALPGGVGALLCSSQLPDTRQAERLLHAAEMSHLKVGLHTAPVVAGSRILFCDGSRLAALHAADMAELWSFAAQAPPPSCAIHNAYCRPAVNGELVAASLGSELHVFDLAKGLHKWSAAPGHAEDTTHVFLSSPCISGNTVLIGAAAWGKEVTCSLFAYDLEKGSLRWKRRVVTGFPTDTFHMGSQPAPPVAWGGAVYFVTNLGAAVCCDVENGAIQWLRKYPAADSYLKEETVKAGRRWALAPPLLYRGVFIAAPQDSSFMFAADALSGTLLWQEPRVGLEELRFLGGTSGNLIFATGSVVRAFHCRSGKVAWTSSLPAPAAGPVAVFSERLVVPCGRVLAQLAPATGKKLGNYALPGEPGLPRHVAGFERNLLLATPLQVERFQCYNDCLKAARASLIVDSTDPAALLTCGSLLWRNGEYDRGMKLLQDCLKNLSDKDPVRAQATTELLLAARTAAESAAGKARGKYFETAARFSAVPKQPQFLLEAARAYESAGLVKKALQVYREVLVNHQARNVVLAGRAVYADDYARVCEREILQSNPALRKKQEELADKLLAEKGPGASPQHLIAVIRAFPNSEAAARAYIRLGEYCIKEKLLVSAELYLSEFLFRNPQSRHADQVRVLLCETYLGRNDILRAKELLSQLSGCQTAVKAGGATQKAGEYARSKLAMPKVAKASLENSLLLPLSRLWQTTPCLAQSAPDIIGTDAGGKILYTLGPNLLDCRSTKTGELFARFDLSSQPVPSTARRAGVVVEGGVVVLSGKRLLMVGADKEKQVWKWGTTLAAPEQAPGTGPREQPLLGKSSTGVLVLWPRNRLIAFNANTGARAWQYKSPKPFLELPVEAGGVLLLVHADGSSAVALDPKTGKEKFKVELKGDTLAASSVTKCGDRVLILRGSRDTHCLDSKGGILWTVKSDSFVSSVVHLAPDRVALIPGPAAKRELKCLDLTDGSLKWKSEISQDDVVAQLADELGLYIAQRPRFGMTSILAFDTATGKRRWLWRQPQSGYALIRQTPDHLIACVVDRLLTRVHIINKKRGAQDQAISLFAEMYQSGLVKNGSLYFTTDRCAYCFSPVKHALAREKYVKVLRRIIRNATLEGELEKLAERYAEFQAFDDAADALGEMVRANWKLSEAETRRLVERAGGYRYSPDHAGSPVIEVPKMEGPVKTDGVLDDGWTPSLAIERGLESIFKVDLPRAGGGEWLAKNDLSATFYFGWDKENFYFALDVRDSIMRPWDRDEKEIWKGDFLLIALDPLGDGGWMPRADDVLLSMGLTLPRRNLTQEEREAEERNKPKGEYFVKRREDGSGAVYEARIPWALFNENGTNIDPQNGPPEGFTFGLDLILLDDDTGGCTTKTLNLARGLLLGRRNALWRAFVPRKFATIRLKGK